MKINKFHKYWIIFRSIFLTLSVSCVVLLKSLFKVLNRKSMDKLSRNWAAKLLKFIKLKYTVIDPFKLSLASNRAYIIMSNHSSLYDIPIIIKALPGSIRMMAKKELFKVPVWGRAMKSAEFIPINRSDGRKVIGDLKYAKHKLEDGIVIWIAPEGTRSRSGELQEFKKGGFLLARQAKAIIVPVGIRGANKILPTKTTDLHINEEVEVHIGHPIDTAMYKASERDKLVDDVKESIKKAANLS